MSQNRTVENRKYDKASFTLAITLAAMSVFGPFSMDTIYPAFKVMGSQFNASDAAMQQLVSVYLLAFAAMSILHGPISDAVGRKPVVIIGSLAYMAASIAASFSGSLPVLLVFRAIQGMTAGSGMIIGRTVVQDLFVGAEAQKQMAMVSMVFSVAPAFAPVVGGWILLAGPWNMIFWFLGLWGAFVAILVAFTLPESLPKEKRVPLKVGVLFASLLNVGKSIKFQCLAVGLICTFAAQFTYISAAPLFVRNILGKGEQDFWMFFVPLLIGILSGSFIQQRLASKLSGNRMIALGLGIAIVTSILNIAFAIIPATSAQLPWAVFAPMGMSCGVQIAFPVLTIQMLTMFPQNKGAASSVQSFEQLLLNAALAGIVAPIATQSILTLALTSFGFLLVGTVIVAATVRYQKLHPAEAS